MNELRTIVHLFCTNVFLAGLQWIYVRGGIVIPSPYFLVNNDVDSIPWAIESTEQGLLSTEEIH